MRPVILFRSSLAEEGEVDYAKKYFDVIESRAQIRAGDLVIPRYSFLPFGDELEKDCQILKANLINTYAKHRYVADLQSWHQDLQDYTPYTWFHLIDAMTDNYNGPFILKGETNSYKNLWETHMFCKDKSSITNVYLNLQNDSLIGQQSIYIRKFEQFKTYGYNIIGQPITKEFRVFVLDGKIIAKGYYWINHPEIIEKYNPDPSEIPSEFLQKVIDIIKNEIRFVVIDVAQREDGEWRVVELNDGAQSGICGVNADELYRNLKSLLKDGK
jgi:hypothetical protein